MKEGSPEYKVFNYLAKNVSQDMDEYNSVAGNCSVSDQKRFEEAILSLTTAGLIEINFIPYKTSYIKKRHEFYHAQRLGLALWYKKYMRDVKREKRKIKHDSWHSWARAWFWWVSLLALVVSGISLWLSINSSSI